MMTRSRGLSALVPLFSLLAAACTTARPAGSGNPTSGGDAQSTSASSGGGATSGAIALPAGPPGIGFDDLRYSSDLGRVLVPAGRSGRVDLITPGSNAVTAIGGFSAAPTFGGGHDFGVTSVDFGAGVLFATDRTTGVLAVIDPAAQKIAGSVKLAASPDYVRWVAPTHEVWVSQPDAEQIEVFTVPSGPSPIPVHAATIAVPGGPESLVIDVTRGRAYTHLWKGSTKAIDLKSRAIVATWPNGCAGSRGIDLDEKRGFLFAGCAEGKAVVLDVATGAILSSLANGAGVDIIAYSAGLGHVYLPGGTSKTMAILGVSARGVLSLLGAVPTAAGAHCATVDASGNVYVCAPDRGTILTFHDAYPSSL
jgi:predicted small secreted protein